MNTTISILIAAYLVASFLFTLFWFLSDSWQNRISEIFCRLFAAERGDK